MSQVVGNFKTYDTISVFRTELPPSTLSAGRLAGGARAYEELCLSPFINEGGTMRFNLLSSELRDPAGVYDFEFQLECVDCGSRAGAELPSSVHGH